MVGLVTFCLVVGLGLFAYFYLHYARLIEDKLSAGPFANTSMLFSAPKPVMLGEELGAEEIVAQLRRSGYGESRNNRMGWYNLRPDAVEIFPGPDSYFDREEGVIKFEEGRVSQIISLRDNTERTQYLLEPELITNLFDRNREKRRQVKFEDLPGHLVNAVVSIEDKRFFQHSGFDPLRVMKAVYEDVKQGYKAQGASTLSMQLARMFWLHPDKTWERKAAEVLITLHLERKLTKEQIFEYYANQVDLGRSRSFNIHGFGEGAQVFFAKDVRQLTLPEAALLAGIIQRPNYFNPYRHPERAKNRRNLVLAMMRENKYITEEQAAEAAAAPLGLAPGGAESTDAPYFVDLVNDELQDRFQDHDFLTNNYRVYTTLDMNLQREAVEAVRIGMQEVDEQLAARRRKGQEVKEPQVALVALDPQTGEVKALVGGRNYGVSQLNRVLAKRQPGSVFKPFVYAAALNTAVTEGLRAITPATTYLDEPTTFWYDSKPYEPNNYKNEFHGVVTLRQAIAKSMNIPTVKIAEAVGYDAVVDLVRQAGMNADIKPTPAVALGAYDVTPLEIAGAYTIFANEGVFAKPNWIGTIRDQNGRAIYERKIEHRAVLDPRVAYMMVNLMEEVMRSGTGAGVRGRGFLLPAAGKTGTSRDGWFAGFTSKLICVVYVGFDDGQELKLEGARSALPVWTEFMKRAHKYREYRNAHPFEAPDGILSVEIDPSSGQLATASCPLARTEMFIAGTQPIEFCRTHGGGRSGTQFAAWESMPPPPVDGASPTAAPPPPPASIQTRRPPPPQSAEASSTPASSQEQSKRRGFFGRIRDIFK